jgi:hypothetical protein
LFGAVAKPSLLYIGLVSSTSFTAFSDGDTAASHSGWTEFTSYDEVTRVQITFGAASSNTITNPTSINFTPSTNGTVVGWFLTTASGKGATTGYLIAESSLLEGTTTVQTGIVQSFTINITDRNI